MITFQKLRYKNFLSTGNNFIEIDFLKTRTTLVVGTNGSGKSTMLDALSFALFGKSHRSINKPQLINSINDKGMLVEVEFLVNTQQYKIVRGLKPTKFEIWKGDELVNQDSHSKEYQNLLEQNILKLNHKSFHQVVVLGSSSFVPFMQLTANNRREVIEDLLDIGVFGKMNAILKEKVSVLKQKFTDNKHQLEILKTKIEGAKNNVRDLKALGERDRAKKEEEIKQLEIEIKELEKHIEERSSELQALIEKDNFNQSPISKKIEKLKAFETKFNHEINSVQKNIDFFSDNKTCPSCDQTIDDSIRDTKIFAGQKRIEELNKALVQVKEEHSQAVNTLEAVISDITLKQHLSDSISLAQSTIHDKDSRIIAIRESLEEELGHEGIIEAENTLQTYIEEYSELIDIKAGYVEEGEYNSVIVEMLKDSGFKAKVIKQYLPAMNKLVNHYLQVLDFYAHFELDEEFKETIKSRHLDSFSYDSFSEGEKQRINLALLFTWRQIAKMKNSVSTNLLVLDETFDSSLDADGVDNLMKILDTLDTKTNVFVISHKIDLLEGMFQSKIEFTKDNNFSTMKVS